MRQTDAAMHSPRGEVGRLVMVMNQKKAEPALKFTIFRLKSAGIASRDSPHSANGAKTQPSRFTRKWRVAPQKRVGPVSKASPSMTFRIRAGGFYGPVDVEGDPLGFARKHRDRERPEIVPDSAGGYALDCLLRNTQNYWWQILEHEDTARKETGGFPFPAPRPQRPRRTRRISKCRCRSCRSRGRRGR